MAEIITECMLGFNLGYTELASYLTCAIAAAVFFFFFLRILGNVIANVILVVVHSDGTLFTRQPA